jgi:hypothetical protein
MDLIIAASADIGALGTGGVKTWIQDNVIVILILIAASVGLWAGSIGKISKVVTIIGGVLLALFLVGLAIGGNWESISNWLTGLLGA